MRHFLILSSFIALNLPIFAQATFKLWVNNTNTEYPGDPVQLSDGSYILPVLSRTSSGNHFNQKILLISAQGNILKQILITNPDGDCHIHNMVYANDSTIIGIGEWKINGQNSKLWYICFDTALSLRWERKYETSYDWFMWVRSFIDLDNHLVSCISLMPDGNLSLLELYFSKINLNGDSITSRYELSGNMAMIFDIFERDSTYLGFGQGFSSSSWGQVLKLDKEFNILAIDSIPYDIHNCITAKSNTDSSFYLTGNTYFGGTSQDIMITLLDKNNDCQLFYRIGKTNDTIDMGGADISMDFITKTNILVGGTSNVNVYNPYHSNSFSWYSLSCFDSLLNLKWTKYYGGDSYYFLRSIIATKDGGALLSGTRYDYLNPDNEVDVYVLKVDSTGIYTIIDETTDIELREAIVYPNPSRETLNIETGLKDAEISLYNLNGKKIKTQELQQGVTRINLQNLASGMYFYRIMRQGKIVESGKWVKE